MNTKGMKFLAVLAVLAMAFAAFAIIAPSEDSDAAIVVPGIDNINKIKKPFEATADTTYVLTADGKITVEGETTAAGVWTNGIYLADGALTLKIKDGETVKMDTNYYGIFVAKGALTITSTGTSTATKLAINVTGEMSPDCTSAFAIANGNNSANTAGKLTISNINLDLKANATSTISNGTKSMGIHAYNDFDLDIDLLAGQTAEIYGGNRGIYCASSVYLDGGSFKIGAYEAAITSNKTVNIGTTAATTVDAKLLDGSGLNDEGSDARFAVKAKKATGQIIVGDGTLASTVTLQGLFATKESDVKAGSKLIITGGYVPNMNDETSDYAGLVIKEAVAENANVIYKSKASEAETGKTTVISGADVYKYILAGYSEKVVPTGDTAAKVKEALNTFASATESVGYLDLSASEITDYSGENALTIPAGKAVVIDFKATSNISGTIDVSSATELSVTNLKVNGTDPLVFIGKDDSKVTITSTDKVSSFTVRNGSVVIEDITTDGTLTVKVNGAYEILGTVSGVGTVSIEKETGATTATVSIADNLFLTGSATVTVTSLPVHVHGKVSAGAGTTLTFAGSSVVNVFGEITGAGSINVIGTTKLEIMDGGVFSATGTVTKASSNKIVAWSGSDINSMAAAKFVGADWVGKDVDGGQWTYSGTTLTLDKYNGTYNFKPISATVTNIILIGDI